MKMSDYISREAAKRLIADIQLGESTKDASSTVFKSGIHEGLNMALGAIVTMRSADARPARPCDGCPFCVCEKHGVICPSDPDFRCHPRRRKAVLIQ